MSFCLGHCKHGNVQLQDGRTKHALAAQCLSVCWSTSMQKYVFAAQDPDAEQ